MKPSDVIDARYRLERLLGTGGMAEVWLAEDRRLGRWVAVKVLRDVLPGEQEGELVSGFRREAHIIARVQHPNIVQVYDAGVYDGRNYIVMEYVHGYSLRALLEAQPRLSEAEAIGYATQLAAALQSAHDKGIVHCDVKPENILISEQQVPKLADFGVAETLTRTLSPQEAREILGTIAYLAPEVIQGADADARSDVYSLALTLYEMVAGRLPWAGANPAAVAGQRLATPAPPVRAFNRAVSPELEAVLGRALALSQDGRFQSAGEFANALRRLPIDRPAGGVAAATGLSGAGAGPAVGGVAGTHRARAGAGDSPLVRRHPTARVARPAPPDRRRSGLGSGALLMIVAAIVLAAGVGVAGAFVLTRDNGSPAVLPTPTARATIAQTLTATPSPTSRPTNEPTLTPTPSISPTATKTTPTPTATGTPTARPSTSPTPPVGSPTPTVSPSPGARVPATPGRRSNGALTSVQSSPLPIAGER